MGYLCCYLTLLSKAGIYHITIYVECPNSVKYQSSIIKEQGTELHNLVLLHVLYSFITNSLLGLMSLAKYLRHLT